MRRITHSLSLSNNSVSQLLVHPGILELVVFCIGQALPSGPKMVGREQGAQEQAGSLQWHRSHESATSAGIALAMSQVGECSSSDN